MYGDKTKTIYYIHRTFGKSWHCPSAFSPNDEDEEHKLGDDSDDEDGVGTGTGTGLR